MRKESKPVAQVMRFKSVVDSLILMTLLVEVPLGKVLAESSKPSFEATREQMVFFENKIRPVLVERCYECHSIEAQKIKSGLWLDSREGWMKGGKRTASLKRRPKAAN